MTTAFLDSSSAALIKGDVVCLIADAAGMQVVTKATPAVRAAVGKAWGIAEAAVAPGKRGSFFRDGIAPSSLTGLSSAGFVRVSSSARCEVRVSYSVGDTPMGMADSRGNTTLALEQTVGALPVAVPAGGNYSVPAVATANFTASYGQVRRIDPTAGALTVQLPSAVGHEGEAIVFKNVVSAGVSGADNPITLLPFGAETIDGEATIVMTKPKGVQQVISDNENWQAAPGIEEAPPPRWHETLGSIDGAWDGEDITFVGAALETWPARVGSDILMPDGSGNGYLADDGGYYSATFTGGGKLSAPVLLSSGTVWAYAVRYRAVATHGIIGCVVGWNTSPTADARWVVACVYATDLANARFGQIATNTDAATSGATTGLGVGTAWQTLYVERDGSTLYVTIAGETYTATVPAGAQSINRINVGWLNHSGSSHIYPFTGAVSHIGFNRTRRWTAQQRTNNSAWTPPP